MDGNQVCVGGCVCGCVCGCVLLQERLTVSRDRSVLTSVTFLTEN